MTAIKPGVNVTPAWEPAVTMNWSPIWAMFTS